MPQSNRGLTGLGQDGTVSNNLGRQEARDNPTRRNPAALPCYLSARRASGE